jgi:hypothetical protein
MTKLAKNTVDVAWGMLQRAEAAQREADEVAKAKTKLSVEAIEAITSYVKGEIAHDKRTSKFLDVLQAEGIRSDMLKAPAKGADSSFYDAFKASVIAGFDAGKRKLLETPTKGMSDSQKKAKREAQQSIGAYIGNIRRDLTKRESEGEGEGEGEGNPTSTFESRLKRDLAKYIAQIEKLEAAKFPVIDMLKYLKSAIVLIK